MAPGPHSRTANDLNTETSTPDDVGADYQLLLSGSKTPPATVRGTKDFAPDGSDKKALAESAARNALHQILTEERHATARSLSQATYDATCGLAYVTQPKGSHFATVGSVMGGRLSLLPEEALFLVERNALMLTHDGALFSVQHAFDLLGGERRIDMDAYAVYAYLKRMGYAVFRARTSAALALKNHVSRRGLIGRALQILAQPFCSLFHFFRSSIARLPNLIPFRRRWPLTHPARHPTLQSLFASLRIIPRLELSPVQSPLLSLQRKPFTPWAFCAHKPAPNFRKSDPGPPDFVVVVHRVSDPLPDMHALRSMFSFLMSPTTQLKIALTDGADVTFLSMWEPSESVLL
ncbi:tRNA-splicing endonuclease subunit sen54 [Geranomyces variabilis]|nr:tRNA-splicing endonuclease subunit sen54 [Geranomyces variabilis]